MPWSVFHGFCNVIQAKDYGVKIWAVIMMTFCAGFRSIPLHCLEGLADDAPLNRAHCNMYDGHFICCICVFAYPSGG